MIPSAAQLRATSLHKPGRPEASPQLPGQRLCHPPTHVAPSAEHPAGQRALPQPSLQQHRLRHHRATAEPAAPHGASHKATAPRSSPWGKRPLHNGDTVPPPCWEKLTAPTTRAGTWKPPHTETRVTQDPDPLIQLQVWSLALCSRGTGFLPISKEKQSFPSCNPVKLPPQTQQRADSPDPEDRVRTGWGSSACLRCPHS